MLDILMKNEVCHSDMVDIMKTMHTYLGSDYPSHRIVASGGDQLTREHQVGAQWHVMDGNTPWDRLQMLEPQTQDWYCLVAVLMVRVHNDQEEPLLRIITAEVAAFISRMYKYGFHSYSIIEIYFYLALDHVEVLVSKQFLGLRYSLLLQKPPQSYSSKEGSRERCQCLT